MTSGPTSDAHLGNTLHNNPDVYWCADCWKWRLDCEHLVEPPSTRHVLLNDWLLIDAAYDRSTLEPHYVATRLKLKAKKHRRCSGVKLDHIAKHAREYVDFGDAAYLASWTPEGAITKNRSFS